MRPLDYLHLQMRLEGKQVVDLDRIREVEAVPGEELPLILLAQLTDGKQITYYSEVMSPDLKEELASAEIDFTHIDPLLQLLKAHGMPCEAGHYKTYVFPSMPANDMEVVCLSKYEARVKAFGFGGFAGDVYAILRGGKIVSACVSARENGRCGEAWVYTDAEHRGQGLAQQVVRAWARSLLEAGKVPFYSHKIENRASAGLAQRLGLQPVFEEVAIELTS
ncbi:MAG TPA: GNAT family N-acetyltransferase [Anaerolineales bacterium]